MDYAGVLIERSDGKILFQLRDDREDIPNPNLWSIFGGGIKENESPKYAAIRELKEELSIIVKKEELELFVTAPSFRKRRFIYRLRWNKGIDDFTLKEGSDMQFYTRNEILKKNNVVPSLRVFLRFYPLIKLFR